MAVVVYDVTSARPRAAWRRRCAALTREARACRADRASFVNTARWVEEVRAERGADVVVVLVGNKTDLVERRRVEAHCDSRLQRAARVMRCIYLSESVCISDSLTFFFFHLHRQVSTEEGDARGREAGVLFIETSAKAGFNIKARLGAII